MCFLILLRGRVCFLRKFFSMSKVSVVMSVYNDSSHLKEAVDSILGQTYSDFEFLIADDGSTDSSDKILDEYATKDARVKVFHQKNIGLTKTLNNLIKQSKGEYIARMDSDDISLSDRFAEEVKFLDENLSVAVISCFAKVIDADSKEIGEHRPGVTNDQIKKLIFFSGQLCHPAVMFRKQAFLSIGGYDENFKYAQDLKLWFKFITSFKVANLPKFLFLWRKTSNGIGVEKFKEQQKFAQLARFEAMQNGLYPKYYFLFLIWPYLRSLVPLFIKKKFRSLISQ